MEPLHDKRFTLLQARGGFTTGLGGDHFARISAERKKSPDRGGSSFVDKLVGENHDVLMKEPLIIAPPLPRG